MQKCELPVFFSPERVLVYYLLKNNRISLLFNPHWVSGLVKREQSAFQVCKQLILWFWFSKENVTHFRNFQTCYSCASGEWSEQQTLNRMLILCSHGIFSHAASQQLDFKVHYGAWLVVRISCLCKSFMFAEMNKPVQGHQNISMNACKCLALPFYNPCSLC